MRKAFTLIELLVVLTIITLVMGVVVPRGIKMLNGFERYLARVEMSRTLSEKKKEAFFTDKSSHYKFEDKRYILTRKGAIFETSDDHH